MRSDLLEDRIFDENGGVSLEQKKPKKKPPSAQPVDSAIPVIRKPKKSDAAKITISRTIAGAMKKHALWSTSKNLRDAGTKWTDTADALEANAARIAAARMQLAMLEDKQRQLRRDWNLATKIVLANVTTVCAGSKDVVQALGFDVRTQAPRVPRPAPTGLVSRPGKRRGEAIFTWVRPNDRQDYWVQRALDPADPGTYSTPVASTKKSHTLKGEAPGSLVYARVAALDPHVPEGHGPWTDWVACTVAS